MNVPIYLSAPDVGALDEQFVLRALRSGWVAPHGPDLAAFEDEVAQRVGAAHAVAVSSGSAALHLALLALGVGSDHTVIVPTLTFAATANAVVYTGARPVFVDCDEATGNIDVALTAELIRMLRSQGSSIGAVVPVDLFGTCADYRSLLPVCAEAGVPVIEDAAEALGATHHGKAAGSFGHAGVFSFNGNKIMTTSGGGMLVCEDPAIAQRCRYLATQARQPVPHYEHHDIGYNYRLSNILAALGRAQLSRLDKMMARRQHLRERYRKLFAPYAGIRVLGDGDPGANCWLTAIIVDATITGWKSCELAEALTQQDIETRPLWKPMHLQPVFMGTQSALTGKAEHLFDSGLTLPSGSSLTSQQEERVFTAIEGFLRHR